jgi:hypothetical protein
MCFQKARFCEYIDELSEHIKNRNLMTSYGTISFSTKTLYRGLMCQTRSSLTVQMEPFNHIISIAIVTVSPGEVVHLIQ